MRQIEAQANVRFPTTVRVRAWHEERGIDAYFEIKFELPAPDWPTFLSSSPFRAVALDAKHRGDLGPDHGDWDPSKPPGLVAAQVELPGAKYVTLGVDAARRDVIVAYLVYFTT
jgi:hypothetical protein